MPDQPIVIIGAGAAGLSAARELSRAGRSLVVLEARARIGGRVFTHKDAESSVPVELGAEFVHGKVPELRRIAQAANLQILETSQRHWYFQNGNVSRSGEFWRTIERLTDEMKSAGSDQSLKQFLETLPEDEETHRAKSMLVRYVEGFHAADIGRIGIRGLVKASEAADEIDGDQAFRLVDGYNSLMETMRAEAESFGATFRLSTLVREIRWKGRQAEIVCLTNPNGDDVESVTASQVIITLPLGVLQRTSNQPGALIFIPDLPGEKRKAIDNLRMGNVVKINLLFRERFWETVKLWDKDANPIDFRDAGFFHCPGVPLPTWWTQLPIRAPLLVGWTGGPNAERVIEEAGRQAAGGRRQEAGRFTKEADPALVDQAIVSLSTIFNLPRREIETQLDSTYMHNWRDDPFSNGAYAYVPVNGLELQRILAQPIDATLFFAGEATSVGHIGTVHGAIQSGQCAAREILNATR